MSLLTFIDNKGRKMQLDSKLTIEDLVKMGIKCGIHGQGEPLPDNWYLHQSHRRAINPKVKK